MPRRTGRYQTAKYHDETVRAFVPHPLPPKNPVLRVEGEILHRHNLALAGLGRLRLAGEMVPSPGWFLYGFVRKEAVISSQIEGTQATLQDLVAFEATHQTDRPADVEEVSNYVAALTLAREEIKSPKGLPLCMRLLCKAHQCLLQGVRGAEKRPGVVRTSQNWIGGSQPDRAKFVPPPPEAVPEALAKLEQWIQHDESLPPLVRAGLAHVQFETIHPFLDGNGRIGRLLITLLVEHWGLLSSPLLYLSVAFKRSRQEYYECLMAVREDGDWEEWTLYFLRCVCEAAEDAVSAAHRLFRLLADDRTRFLRHEAATLSAVRLLDLLPEHPMISLPDAIKVLGLSKPTANKAIDALCEAGVLHEVTGKRRNRVYSYAAYLDVLSEDTGIPRG